MGQQLLEWRRSILSQAEVLTCHCECLGFLVEGMLAPGCPCWAHRGRCRRWRSWGRGNTSVPRAIGPRLLRQRLLPAAFAVDRRGHPSVYFAFFRTGRAVVVGRRAALWTVQHRVGDSAITIRVQALSNTTTTALLGHDDRVGKWGVPSLPLLRRLRREGERGDPMRSPLFRDHFLEREKRSNKET